MNIRTRIHQTNEAIKNWRAYREYLQARLNEQGSDYFVDGQMANEDAEKMLTDERDQASKRIADLSRHLAALLFAFYAHREWACSNPADNVISAQWRRLALLFIIVYLRRGWPFDFPTQGCRHGRS